MLDTAKFRELMREKDVHSLKDLSQATKIPYTTLNYMLGGHDMYVSTIVELSKFFQVPIDYLISKSYGVRIYRENGTKFIETTSLIEAAMLS